MSGIEVAGIILGVIPLVISGLEHYGEGARTIKSMWNYPQEFATLSRRLRAESDIFRNALELLLDDCVDNDTLTELLNNAGGELWAEPKIADELRRKLARSYKLFIETINSMSRALDRFRERLKLDANGKGPFTDPRSFREAYKRFRFGLRKTAYMDLVNEISIDNLALTKLTEQSSALESVRASRGKRMPDFDTIREKAATLFSTLQGSLLGSCSTSHRASFYLQDSHNDHAQGSFRVVLHHETRRDAAPGLLRPSWLFEETEVRALHSTPRMDQLSARLRHLDVKKRTVQFQMDSAVPESSTAQSQAKQADLHEIQDLCQSIGQLRTLQCGICLGYLMDASLNRYGLYWPSIPVVDKDSMMTVSLASALRGLTVAESRRLALSLASGMLRLHDTPWMAKQWGRNEVTLFKKGNSLLAQHPFLTVGLTDLQAMPSTPGQYFAASPSIRNETIFALGILLIELCMRKPFDDLILPSDLNPDGTKHPASDYFAANNVLDQIYAEAGLAYGDVVRRCVLCDFDHRKTSLTDSAFRKKVYEGVVAILEQEAGHYPSSD